MNQKYNTAVYKTIQDGQNKDHGKCFATWEIDDMSRTTVLKMYSAYKGFNAEVPNILHILCMGD